MKYMTYYETEELLSEQEYTIIYEKLIKEYKELQQQKDKIERLYFTSAFKGQVQMPVYSVCRKQTGEIYLEKTSSQNSTFWRECGRITAEELQNMKRGRLDWMKGDARHLVRDFYLQITLNCLEPAYREIYEREAWRGKQGDEVIFSRNAYRIENGRVTEGIPGACVQMKVRRAKTVPRVIQNMLQGTEFVAEVPAYA